MVADKVYSREEMRDQRIFTGKSLRRCSGGRSILDSMTSATEQD